MRLDKGRHGPELFGHLGDTLLRGGVGHVHREAWDVPELRQPAEGELVGVAGQGGVEDEPGPGHDAGLGQAKQDFVVGAVALRHAPLLRRLHEHPLRRRGHQIAGQPLGQHRGDVQGVEHLAGEEDVDAGRPAGAAQGGGHGAGRVPLHGAPGGEHVFGREVLHLYPHQGVGRAEQGAGTVRVPGHLAGDQAAQGLDGRAWHRDSFPKKRAARSGGPKHRVLSYRGFKES